MKKKRKHPVRTNAVSSTDDSASNEDIDEIINSTFDPSINESEDDDNNMQPVKGDNIKANDYLNDGSYEDDTSDVDGELITPQETQMPSLIARIDMNLLTEATKAKIFENAKHLPSNLIPSKVTDGKMVQKVKIPTKKLVEDAITHLNERSGSSIIAITKFILSNNPDLDAKRLSIQIKRYVKKSLLDGKLIQVKRSFKLKPIAKKSKTDEKETVKRKTKTQIKKTELIENAKVAKNAKDAKDVKVAKVAKVTKVAKVAKDPKNAKNAKNAKNTEDGKDAKNAKDGKDTKNAKDAKKPKDAKASKEKIKNNIHQKVDEQKTTKQNKVTISTTEGTSSNASRKPKNQVQAVDKTSMKISKKESNNEKPNSKQLTVVHDKQQRKLTRKSKNMLTNPVPSRSKISGIKQPKAKKPAEAPATKTESKAKRKK